jgi:hypothetical protein
MDDSSWIAPCIEAGMKASQRRSSNYVTTEMRDFLTLEGLLVKGAAFRRERAVFAIFDTEFSGRRGGPR